MRSACRPPILANFAAKLSVAATAAASTATPFFSCLVTSLAQPRSRARTALAVSTSALTPVARAARWSRRSATVAAAAAKRSRPRSTASWSTAPGVSGAAAGAGPSRASGRTTHRAGPWASPATTPVPRMTAPAFDCCVIGSS